jgi:hypothetical protein
VRRLAPLLLLLVTATAQAQMGDMRAMLGRPLPTPQLPAGTVNVRVSQRIPINGVPNIEVTAIVVAPGGESRKKVVKTGPEGWATFEGLKTGSTFEATATVDGETLKVAKFPIPESGGIRVMLVAALGGGAAAEPEEPSFSLGAVAGKVAPGPGLPAGTLELTLLDQAGKPIAGRLVQLGQVTKEAPLKVLRATSSATGVARFEGLDTGENTGYAALIEHEGMRLSTEPFRMEAAQGMRGEIRALGRTSDPSVLRFDNRARLIVEVGEDSLQMMEELIFKNTSDKAFDPGNEGLLIPLPLGFEGAKEIEGSVPLDLRAGQGAAVRAPISPNSGAMFATRVRVGFVLPAGGSPDVEVKQKLPFGLEGALVLVPANTHLTVEASGLRERPAQADAQGNSVKLYELDAIPPGGTLSLTVKGLPALDHKGRNIAGALCLLLIVAAVIASPRPTKVAHAVANAAQLTERREKLFGELVALEQQRRQGRPEGKRDAGLEERRQELVSKLEHVYRELAAVEHGPRAAS